MESAMRAGAVALVAVLAMGAAGTAAAQSADALVREGVAAHGGPPARPVILRPGG